MAKLEEILKLATQRDLSEIERQELISLLSELPYGEAQWQLSVSMSTVGLEEGINSTLASAMLSNIFDEGRSAWSNTQARPVHRVHFLKTAWFRYAAAILLIITGVSLYYIISHTSKREIAAVQNLPISGGKQELPPGYNRAVLTLSNGKKIELDSAASETIKDGALSIENNNGQLIYFDRRSLGEAGKKDDLVAMNTMTTPKGGQYQLTLSDGTKVWLNAASSITYPTVFNKKSREVSIMGEVYFEVKKDPSKPFVVKTPSEDIMVLGTEFNVNAYADEMTIKTSLVNGSIKVGEKVLEPGEAFTNGKVIITNLQQDVAWKNGVFDFKDLNVEQAMRQISRWYNLEVVYRNGIPDIRFFGRISRNVSLSTVLLALEKAGVKFIVEGNKLIVQ